MAAFMGNKTFDEKIMLDILQENNSSITMRNYYNNCLEKLEEYKNIYMKQSICRKWEIWSQDQNLVNDLDKGVLFGSIFYPDHYEKTSGLILLYEKQNLKDQQMKFKKNSWNKCYNNINNNDNNNAIGNGTRDGKGIKMVIWMKTRTRRTTLSQQQIWYKHYSPNLIVLVMNFKLWYGSRTYIIWTQLTGIKYIHDIIGTVFRQNRSVDSDKHLKDQECVSSTSFICFTFIFIFYHSVNPKIWRSVLKIIFFISLMVVDEGNFIFYFNFYILAVILKLH